MSEDYVREKLSQAIDSLATGAGTLDVRLHSALMPLVNLRPEDFVDDESRGKFTQLMYLATDEEAAADEGTLAATLASLSDNELRELADLVVWLDRHYPPLR